MDCIGWPAAWLTGRTGNWLIVSTVRLIDCTPLAHWPYCMPCWLCCVTHCHDTTGCSARLTAHYIVWLIDSTDWLIDWLYIAWLIDRSSWLTDCIAWLTLIVWPMIVLRDCLDVPLDWRGIPGAWVCVALLTFFHVEAINNNYLCEYSSKHNHFWVFCTFCPKWGLVSSALVRCDPCGLLVISSQRRL